MLCPFDATDLKVVNRQGIDIDWCPACKGVWLERGELEKLIERSDHDDDDDDRFGGAERRRAAPLPPPGYATPQPGYQAGLPAPVHQAGYEQPYGHDPYRGKPYKKKKSFLREMLDFD